MEVHGPMCRFQLCHCRHLKTVPFTPSAGLLTEAGCHSLRTGLCAYFGLFPGEMLPADREHATRRPWRSTTAPTHLPFTSTRDFIFSDLQSFPSKPVTSGLGHSSLSMHLDTSEPRVTSCMQSGWHGTHWEDFLLSLFSQDHFRVRL